MPGVPGIGIKTAAELINQFGNLEKLLENAKKIKQNKRRETLIENKDKAVISKKLVTLEKNVPVKNKIEEFKLKDIDKNKLCSYLREMEFNRLLSLVISEYGEPSFSDKNLKSENTVVQKKISKDQYSLIKNEE